MCVCGGLPVVWGCGLVWDCGLGWVVIDPSCGIGVNSLTKLVGLNRTGFLGDDVPNPVRFSQASLMLRAKGSMTSLNRSTPQQAATSSSDSLPGTDPKQVSPENLLLIEAPF